MTCILSHDIAYFFLDVHEDKEPQRDMSEVWEELVPWFITDLFLPKASSVIVFQ